MRKIQIKICDDEQYFVDELNHLIVTVARDMGYGISVESYTDVELLLEHIIEEKQVCHMVFLDVDMPKLSGVDAGWRLRNAGYDGTICFVTSHEKYALDAYRVEALGYVVKPARYEDVCRLFKRAVADIYYRIDAEEAKKRYIEVMWQNTKHIVDLERVLYIEKCRNKSIIHMEDGELACYEPLKSLYGRINQETFVYSHQGYIVNVDKIKEVRPDCVCFGYGREAPVSRKYYKGLRERHIDMIRKM